MDVEKAKELVRQLKMRIGNTVEETTVDLVELNDVLLAIGKRPTALPGAREMAAKYEQSIPQRIRKLATMVEQLEKTLQ